MALTESNLLEIGKAAPDFSLKDTVTGSICVLNNLKGDKGTVVMFICNHCPYVVHIIDGLIDLANDYNERGISFVAISSNDADKYPQDGPDKMKEYATQLNFPFPYLYDETQEVAKAYAAACTPDLYIFDTQLRAVYHGQLDDSRPGNGIPVSGSDMRLALDALLSGKVYDKLQKQSIGCNIKWRL